MNIKMFSVRLAFGAILTSSVACAAEFVSAEENALAWLAAHQEADGHWDSVKYSAAAKTDTAATSLALLAFLSVGHSEKVGPYKENVQRAVAWLVSQQDASGGVFAKADAGDVQAKAFGTTLAALALSEAAANANVASTRTAAQKAVDYCASVYPVRASTDASGQTLYAVDEAADTPTVGWCVMALKSARVAGLKVPYPAFDALVVYLDAVEYKFGRPNERGDSSALPSSYLFSRTERLREDFPMRRLSAIGTLCRQFMGWKGEELRASVEYFTDKGTFAALPDDQQPDLYDWYHAKTCLYQQGWELMGPWDKAMKAKLLEKQCSEGEAAGNWNPTGYTGQHWGRVGQTALATMSLWWPRYRMLTK